MYFESKAINFPRRERNY